MLLNPPIQFVLSLTVMSGTLLTLFASNWFVIYVGLELNTIAFIPFLYNKKSHAGTSAMVTYLIAQVVGSALLLLGGCSLQYNLHQFFTPDIIIFLSLLIKAGISPFHSWYILSMTAAPSWLSRLTLSTWQKIGPLFLIINNLEPNTTSFFILPALLSAVVGAIGALNTNSLPTLIAFSSLTHMGWFMAAVTSCLQTALIYFLFYLVTSIGLMIIFFILETLHTQSFLLTPHTNKLLKFLMNIFLISMAGLPPFLGFFAKLLVIKNLAPSNIMTIYVLLLSSAMILFAYLKIIFHSSVVIQHITPYNTTNIPHMLLYALPPLLLTISAPLLFAMVLYCLCQPPDPATMLTSLFLCMLLLCGGFFYLSSSLVLCGMFLLSFATLLTTLLSTMMLSWFSLTIFLIYVGGLLILLSYFLAISPNHPLVILPSKSLFILLLMLFVFLGPHPMYLYCLCPNNINNITILFTPQNMFLLVFIPTLLFITMVVIVKLSCRNAGSLRPFL